MNTDAPYWTKKAGLWSLLKYYIGWLCGENLVNFNPDLADNQEKK